MKVRRSRFYALAAAAAASAAALAWMVAAPTVADWHGLYMRTLAAAFVFWNSVRILTYLPTMRLLVRRGASGRDYSVLTWASWTCSNGTLALYLFEVGGHRIDSLVVLNGGNALMCMLTCALILRLKLRESDTAHGPGVDGCAPVAFAAAPLATPATSRRCPPESWRQESAVARTTPMGCAL